MPKIEYRLMHYCEEAKHLEQVVGTMGMDKETAKRHIERVHARCLGKLTIFMGHTVTCSCSCHSPVATNINKEGTEVI